MKGRCVKDLMLPDGRCNAATGLHTKCPKDPKKCKRFEKDADFYTAKRVVKLLDGKKALRTTLPKHLDKKKFMAMLVADVESVLKED